jgi:hypothetical protein
VNKMLCVRLATLIAGWAASAVARDARRRPIVLDESGGFSIGGQVLVNPENSNQTLSCGHAYVEYFMPWTPRSTSLVMWHSSSTQSFQNRWDGGEGYKDMFLRRDYPVYFWEGPAVGRANWDCLPYNVSKLIRVPVGAGRTFSDHLPGRSGVVYGRV